MKQECTPFMDPDLVAKFCQRARKFDDAHAKMKTYQREEWESKKSCKRQTDA